MKPTLFIDQDSMLIDEPKTDFQIDSLEKLKLEKGVIVALLALQKKIPPCHGFQSRRLRHRQFPPRKF